MTQDRIDVDSVPSVSSVSSVDLDAVLEPHRPLLWSLCYRMTGCAADADDLVQETFARAIERPPADTRSSWRPWLVRVAMNLGRDELRRRRRRRYVGPWLPSPIEIDAADPPSHEELGTEGRYELLESLSYAFLLALEALTPQQRAVLLLRDVLGYSVRETAGALDLSESNVKTSHHRARRALRDYDAGRSAAPGAELARHRRVAKQLLDLLQRRDMDGFEALLAEDVRMINDGAGEFFAAGVPVVGRDKVARVHRNLADGAPERMSAELCSLNGAPALVVTFDQTNPAFASRVAFRFELDADGRIREIHWVLASRKLTALRFPELPGADGSRD